MYIEKPEAAKKFVATLKRRNALLLKADVVIVPPFTLIATLFASIGKSKNIRLGAQTISPSSDAKHTGDVSAPMLKIFGVGSVIVGHSERRAAGETDDMVRAQIKSVHNANMTAVLCVGEVERDQHGSHFGVIETQLMGALKDKTGGKLLVAYEPVWAIGKTAGDAMKSAELQEMVIFIRKTLADIVGREPALKVPILYGGSVEDTNAQELLKDGGVGGFLVGHASTDVDSFLNILKSIQ